MRCLVWGYYSLFGDRLVTAHTISSVWCWACCGCYSAVLRIPLTVGRSGWQERPAIGIQISWATSAGDYERYFGWTDGSRHGSIALRCFSLWNSKRHCWLTANSHLETLQWIFLACLPQKLAVRLLSSPSLKLLVRSSNKDDLEQKVSATVNSQSINQLWHEFTIGHYCHLPTSPFG